jgi:hypothetical protein
MIHTTYINSRNATKKLIDKREKNKNIGVAAFVEKY